MPGAFRQISDTALVMFPRGLASGPLEVVGAVCGVGRLFGSCEDARTDAVDGEIYPSGGVEEVQARIENGLITSFGGGF